MLSPVIFPTPHFSTVTFPFSYSTDFSPLAPSSPQSENGHCTNAITNGTPFPACTHSPTGAGYGVLKQSVSVYKVATQNHEISIDTIHPLQNHPQPPTPSHGLRNLNSEGKLTDTLRMLAHNLVAQNIRCIVIAIQQLTLPSSSENRIRPDK